MTSEFVYICTHIKHYTQDISLFILHPTTENKITYQAGQYVEVTIADVRMPMSIANMPEPDGRLEFHLRHDKKHPQAQYVMTKLAMNTSVCLRGPFGNTTLTQADNTKQLLFLAGGTGFAPIKALLESALYHQRQNNLLHLYWGIRNPQDGYQEELLCQWQQEFPHFRYFLVLSEPAHFPHWSGPTGLVHEYLAKEHVSLADYCIYASGPYEMIKAAKHHFMGLGLAATNQFISDIY